MDRSRQQPEVPEPLAVIRWSFFAFVFALLFEDINLGPVEPTMVLAIVFLLTTLLQPRLCYRLPHPAILCFVAYLYVSFVLSAFFSGARQGEVLFRLCVLTQLVLISWTGYNLMLREEVARGALRTYAVACVALCLLQVAGVASMVQHEGIEAERITAFGFHPNTIARILGMGLLILFGLTFGRSRSRATVWVWAAFLLIAFSIVRTGSRGGLLAFAAGFLILSFQGRTLFQKARNFGMVLAGIAVVAALSLASDTTRSRFETTMETGSLTRRELIYPAAWQMFLERPFLGWGPVTNTWELGDRLNHPEEPRKDTHNMVLYVLTAAGVVGALPFLLGLALWLRAAWQARSGPAGILPLALTVFMLVANTSATGLYQKLMWFVLAYVVASCRHGMEVPRLVPVRLLIAPRWAWRSR